jgi:diguanylate cyclase (GGDEF)-like protein
MGGNGQHAESAEDRRSRARSAAGLFAAGAAVSTTVTLLPGWTQMDRAGILVTAVIAGLGALGLYAFADHLGRAAIHAAFVVGTALIAICQVLARGGSATAMYAMLYVWVVLHSALYFRRRVVVAHLALTTFAHLAALGWLGAASSLAEPVVLTLGTQVAAASVVWSLANRQRLLADTDALTGLANRRVVERTLAWEFERSRRPGVTPPCVAVLDLDGFKAFNDHHGHAAGDRVLVQAAAAWRGLLRATDTLARTGGDEFVLILHGCDLPQAERIVRRMVAVTPDGVTCSAGLVRCDTSAAPTVAIERADQALYRAKDTGRPVIVPGGHVPPQPA